ncbi:DUF3817 domain-containing protein [Sphingobacterium corticis]|uniref:DUF3817 domain-containing protein n=1 Tax=Sphingobacterium corticis TaxID=1812823 RepID=A0ABW5NJE1_9SPHI
MNFKSFFQTSLGRLRLLAFLEGASLLLLIGLAVPMKHAFGQPALSSFLGPIHGALFLLFMIKVISVGIELKWPKRRMALMFIACFIPFGTFYIDHKYLKKAIAS